MRGERCEVRGERCEVRGARCEVRGEGCGLVAHEQPFFDDAELMGPCCQLLREVLIPDE